MSPTRCAPSSVADVPPFQRICIVGLGLIGSSIARAARAQMPGVDIAVFDAAADVRAAARSLNLGDHVHDSIETAAAGAELVILCVPVGAIGTAAAALAPHLPSDAIVTDVGSSKAAPLAAMRAALPGHIIVPGHPVAGTELSGPAAGFATLFANRWCILTPPTWVDAPSVARVRQFWERLGANVEMMTPEHHDIVLAVTSHLPHLIAYTITGTASDLETVTQSEVIKYSAGGFRDFTRIAASDPTMWRDVFLNNKDAVLQILQRFTEDLTLLQRAIRLDDGASLFDHFSRTRAIRRGIIDQGQDDGRPDFGRAH